jgi:hypothetical protein
MDESPPVQPQAPAESLHGAYVREDSKKYRTLRNIFIILVICVVVIAVLLAYLENANTRPAEGCGECGPPGWVGGLPSSTSCGTTADALYFESVSVTSTSTDFTTNTVGLKVIPTAGGLSVPNVEPPASGSPCPTRGGFYVALESSSGQSVACWTNVSVGGSLVWSSPTSGVCANPNGAALGSPITIDGGMSLIVYMYGAGVVPPMGGAYTMQAYGINGATVAGEVDL